MKNFVLFQGGTGSMVAKAFAHLVAIGMVDPSEEIIARLCDKDEHNLDTRNAELVLQQVANISASDFLAPATGNGICDDKTCFNTKLSYSPYNFSADLKNNIMSDNENLSLAECLRARNSDSDKILMDAFFSKAQQDEPTTIGFKGSAARGAAMYSYLLKKSESIFDDISKYLNANEANHCRVIIVGSIFGGTGASMFLKTAEEAKKLNPGRVHVGGILVLPSFAFSNKDGCDIRSDKFWAKTITSLKGYSDYPNLVKTDAKDTRGILDRLYLAVQPNNELHSCAKQVSEGGRDQERYSDFIDVVAANYIVDFINAKPEDDQTKCFAQTKDNCSNVYSLNYPAVSATTPLTLGCIAGLERKITVMLRFASLVLRLKDLCQSNGKLSETDWVPNLFKQGMFDKTLKNNANAIGAAIDAVISPLFDYCRSYIEFIGELADNGKNRDPNMTDYSALYKFFIDETTIRSLVDYKDKVVANDGKVNENNVLNISKFTDNDFSHAAVETYNNCKDAKHKADSNITYKDTIEAYVNRLYGDIEKNN